MTVASRLDLDLPVGALTAALVDVPSVSGRERALADLVQAALTTLPHLRVGRDGDAVVARTEHGRARRVLLAGHLDTVPIAGNLPSRVADGRLYGCGAADMKAGVAVQLRLAATVVSAAYDLTYVFYDNEEVEAAKNGLGRLARSRPDWLAADFAVLLEPTSGRVEAGCQGTLRVAVRVAGRRAHSARSWLGENAIHAAAPVLARLAAYTARTVEIDGCRYREGLSAVGISGGVAGNVIPDACTITVNYRFAPDRSPAEAYDHVAAVFAGHDIELLDSAAGAPPGLRGPEATSLLARVAGGPPVAKYGWTDVARFAELGVPAANFGPGDPNLAHTREEYVELALISRCEDSLRGWLTGAARPPAAPTDRHPPR